MGCKKNYENKHKSKRNKRSKGAKKRWNAVKLRKQDEKSIPTLEAMNFFDAPMESPQSSPQLHLDGHNNFSVSMSVSSSDSEYSDSESDEFEIETHIKRNANWANMKYENRRLKKNKEPGVISSDECERINNFPLEVEKCPKVSPPIIGNRIVELGYILDKVLELQYNHSKVCTDGRLRIVGELRKGLGLASKVTLKCIHCKKIYQVHSENPDNGTTSSINLGAVWGTLATGSTFAHLEELLSCINIPTMPEKLFYSLEESLGTEWRISLDNSMLAAGKIERDYAVANNQISKDGIPWIKVYVDGSWSKRSYGTNFNSLSGMAAIIGGHTGKVIFVAVRNKYCSICVRAQNKGDEPKDHVCYMNWTKSASAMESDMVVEGFNSNLEMYGVKFLKFVADGDSRVYHKIKEQVSYGTEITKLECTNHAIKNYGKNLRKIKADTHIALQGRKLLTQKKIDALTKRAKFSINHHAKAEERNVDLLREDLETGIHHVFADHSKCREGICNSVGDVANSLIPQLKDTTIYHHIKGTLDLLTRKTRLIIENENNNRAERLMNIVSRFSMGKRLNLVQRGSYERRVYLSALRYNENSRWYCSPWKRAQGGSPGKIFKQYIEKCQSGHENKTKRRLFADQTKNDRKTRNKETPRNMDYGPTCLQPAEDPDILQMECDHILNNLQVTPQERDRIQSLSVGQFGNQYYEAERKLRLTASLFGRVIKRRSYTPCHSIVKTCLKPTSFFSEATEYGITKEDVVKRLFEKEKNLPVRDSGLWIDLQNGFLAASPDGLVGEEALVEIKCLYLKNAEPLKTIEDVINLKKREKKLCCLEIKNGVVSLKRNHSYYFQVQGQLSITGKAKCYFVVYVNDSIKLFIEEIGKDEEFWRNEMLPELSRFYKECIAPEIFRDNLGKGLNCLDPPYIQQAIDDHSKRKTKTTKHVTALPIEGNEETDTANSIQI